MNKTAFVIALIVHLSSAKQTASINANTSVQNNTPNFLFIMVDDLGWNGFGYNSNNQEVITPNIDSLARRGVILKQHYVYKFCSPTRASFLTGRTPGHGIWEKNPKMTSPIGVNIEMTMLPAMLKKANYSTYHVGKWHQGFFKHEYTPAGRGFDDVVAFLGGGEDHFTQCSGCANTIPPPDYASGPVTCPAECSLCSLECPHDGGVDLYGHSFPLYKQNGTYTSDIFREAANSMLIRHPSDKPFFMYLALHNVHQPVEAQDHMLDLYSKSNYNESTLPRRFYNAMHSTVDLVVDSVVNTLKHTGLYENTIIVLSADNGGTYEHGMPVPGSSNFPLRGHKYSYFEGGVRASAFVHSPLLPADVIGTETYALMHISDWWTTFIELAGLHADDGYNQAPPDGVNVWPMITAGETVRPASRWAAIGGPQKDEVMLGVGTGSVGALRKGAYKLIVGAQERKADGWSAQYPGSTPAIPPPSSNHEACSQLPCLFNIMEDERELTDLSRSKPLILAELYERRKSIYRYQTLAQAMNKPNGDEDTLESDNEPLACILVRLTGFWQPWL
eukprot:gene10207-2364_t